MSAIVIALVAFLVAAALVFGIINYLASRRSSSVLSRLGNQSSKVDRQARDQSWMPRTDRAPLLSSLLQGTSLWDELQMEIIRAGWLLKPSELLSFMGLAALAGAAIGLLLLKQLYLAILLAGLGGAMPWIALKIRQAKRMQALANQLPDAIDMLSSALRSGFSFLRGVQTIAGQMQPPISEEFRRLATEVQMGMATDEALDNLVDRTRCYDLELLVAAVQIQLEMGGNLAEVLDNIAHTIRERIRLQGEINAATAEVRMSAGVLLAMPIGIAIAINFLNPGYIKPLLTTPIGLGMILLAGLLMALGAIVIRKMLDVDL